MQRQSPWTALLVVTHIRCESSHELESAGALFSMENSLKFYVSCEAHTTVRWVFTVATRFKHQILARHARSRNNRPVAGTPQPSVASLVTFGTQALSMSG